jgi:uncharacterized membrane protein
VSKRLWRESVVYCEPTVHDADLPATIHPMLVPIPIACFVGVLLTDLTYWWSAEMMWANFSAWLVSVGVIFGYLAAVFGLIDFLSSRFIRAQPPAWPHAIGNVALLILATLNMFVHSRDAWPSVVPWGLALSAATVLVLKRRHRIDGTRPSRSSRDRGIQDASA